MFSMGNYVGFTNILIGELNADNAEITVTLDELTWYSMYQALMHYYILIDNAY